MTVRTTLAPLALHHEANPVHRDPSRSSHHTQWSPGIDESDEFAIFSESVARAWGAPDASYWGIRLQADGHLETLNDTRLHDDRIAKWCRFVGNMTPQIWHGYPTWPDPQRDCPPQAVLLAWARYRPLSVAKVAKILRGRQCSF